MPPKATLRILAEELSARGWSSRKIAKHLGMAEDYARHIVNIVNGTESNHNPFLPTAEDHERHIVACLIEGGFPVAVTFRRGTAWIAHDGSLWRHLKRQRRAA